MSEHRTGAEQSGPEGDGALSPAVTQFLRIVMGVGATVATIAAVSNPVGGAVAGVAGLVALGTAASRLLPRGPAEEGSGEDEGDEGDGGDEDGGSEETSAPDGASGAGLGGGTEDGSGLDGAGGPAKTGRNRTGKKKRGSVSSGPDAKEANNNNTGGGDDDGDAKDGGSGAWQAAPTRKPRVQRTQAELDQARLDLIRHHVAAIQHLAVSVVGSGNFPMSTNPEREGCVTHGPGYSVPDAIAGEVRDAIDGLEGVSVQAGGMALTFHIVNKSRKQYNLTLHGRYREKNPRTKANVHVDNQG